MRWRSTARHEWPTDRRLRTVAPAEVLQALDERRLMFFCGAGISMGTESWGLPGFAELTRLAYERCNQPMAGNQPKTPLREMRSAESSMIRHLRSWRRMKAIKVKCAR